MTSEEEVSDQTYERTFPHQQEFSEDDQEESSLEIINAPVAK